MDIKEVYKENCAWWFCLDLLLPCLIYIIVWLSLVFLLKKSFAFERVFSSADLMPIGCVFILSTIREIEAEDKNQRLKNRCVKRKYGGLLLAIVTIFSYGVLKIYSFTFSIPDSIKNETTSTGSSSVNVSNTSLDPTVFGVSILSIASMFACVLYAVYLKTSVYKNLREGA